MKTFATTIFFGFVVTCSASADQVISGGIQWHSDLDVATQEVKQHQRPLLILFTMDNCLYCQKLKAVTYGSQLVQSKVSESFVASVVNGPLHPKLAERLNVKLYPTTVIISPQGRVVESIAGFIDSAEMESRLSAAKDRVRVAMKKK